MTNQELIYAINDELVRLGVSQDYYLHQGLSCEERGGILVVCNDHRSVAINPEATLEALHQLTPTSQQINETSQEWQVLVKP